MSLADIPAADLLAAREFAISAGKTGGEVIDILRCQRCRRTEAAFESEATRMRLDGETKLAEKIQAARKRYVLDQLPAQQRPKKPRMKRVA